MSDMYETYETITDPSKPDYRARVVRDPYPDAPDGDTYAPTLFAAPWSRGTHFMKGVYVPEHAQDIIAASERFGPDDLFERYLRMAQGATRVEAIDLPSSRYYIFDTPDWRERVGVTETPVDLSGERETWQAYLDGEVFGLVIERRRTGTTTWDDGEAEVVEDWVEEDSVWGHYGAKYAEEEARQMLSTY